MKTYIEAIEDTEKENPDFIQQEVNTSEGLSADTNALNKVKAKEKAGKYNYRKHFCYHDEEISKPCTVEEIN